MRSKGILGIDNKALLSLILAISFIWSLFQVEWSSGVVHGGGLSALWDAIASIINPRVDAEIIRLIIKESWRTFAYAVAGLSVALCIGFPIGVVASGTLLSTRFSKILNIAPARFFLAAIRSVHELVWAWFFVTAFGLTPMAAVLAIGIPYGGIIGRIFAEILQDVPAPPLRALRSTGANEWKVLIYGRLSIAAPSMISYTSYRFECAIRAAAVMSFVGLGGLGHQIQISIQDLAYGRVWTFLFVLIFLIVIVDIWSTALRSRLSQ